MFLHPKEHAFGFHELLEMSSYSTETLRLATHHGDRDVPGLLLLSHHPGEEAAALVLKLASPKATPHSLPGSDHA